MASLSDYSRGRFQGALLLGASLATGCQPALPVPAPTFAVSPVALTAPVATGWVEGKVAEDHDGEIRPVAGAVVTVPGTALRAVTGPDGRYLLKDVPAGSPRLAVHHDAFAPGTLTVRTTSVSGLNRANVLLRSREYRPQQAAAYDARVAGVVYDPRGAALPGATVTVTCAAGNGGRGTVSTLNTDGDGYFSIGLPNVTPGATAPTLKVEARGISPGGIQLETSAALEEPLAGARHVLSVQADKLPDMSTPTIDGATFVLAGQEGRIRVSPLSTRPDEFYIRLKSGTETFDVLPIDMAGDLVTFRVPATLPDAGFTVSVVPFGQVAKTSEPSPEFLSRYTQADLDADLRTSGAILADATVAAGTLNGALFVGGDQARLSLELANVSTRVRQTLDLTGQVPTGTTIAAVKVDGADWPAGSIEAPNGTGVWRVKDLTMPLAGSLPVEVLFTSPSRLTHQDTFGVTNLAIQMPTLNLSASPAPATALVVSGLNSGSFTVAKNLRDDATAGNGIGQVVLTLTPTGSSALGAFKLTDVTKTEVSSSATAASFTGTTVLPAAGSAIGLALDEHLDLKIDGGATQIVKIFSSNYDAETLIGQINTQTGLSGSITAARSSNRFYLERVAQGPTRTLEILSSSSPNLLTKLGLTAGLKASGYLADLTGATATQAGGSAWTLTTVSNTWTTSTGSQSVNLTLRPPATYAPGDGPTQPITLVYNIRKYNGLPAVLGGGSGATFGPKVTAVNLLSPFTDATKDQSLNKTAADAPSTSGL